MQRERRDIIIEFKASLSISSRECEMYGEGCKIPPPLPLPRDCSHMMFLEIYLNDDTLTLYFGQNNL